MMEYAVHNNIIAEQLWMTLSLLTGNSENQQ